jgi:hypothetical protein
MSACEEMVGELVREPLATNHSVSIIVINLHILVITSFPDESGCNGHLRRNMFLNMYIFAPKEHTWAINQCLGGSAGGLRSDRLTQARSPRPLFPSCCIRVGSSFRVTTVV